MDLHGDLSGDRRGDPLGDRRGDPREDLREDPRDFPEAGRVISRLVARIETRMFGKTEAVRKLVIAVLAGGHALIEDVPGTGKTLLVKTLAQSIGCSFRRIQFAPDLLPSDITGAAVFNQRTGDFEFKPGPLFSANLLLADELNRASPRTQAALLEAMEELRVTVDGESRELERPFIVLATQNPLEHEGTYPLPEAQLDRFLLRIRLGYPDAGAEVRMLDSELARSANRSPDRPQDRSEWSALSREWSHDPAALAEPTDADGLPPVLTRDMLLALRRMAAEVYVDEAIKRYIVDLARATRAHPDLACGVSPRAAIALMKAAQARALAEGRSYVIPDDVKALVKPVFAHRLKHAAHASWTGLGLAAGAGLASGGGDGAEAWWIADERERAVDRALDSILARVPVPLASFVPYASSYAAGPHSAPESSRSVRPGIRP